MIKLVRDYESLAGTHGTLTLNGAEYHTIERPDLNNLPFESCVPLGEYDLVPFDSPKFGPCYVMVNKDLNVYFKEEDVDRPSFGRYLCLFCHRGNEVENFVGCIGAGPSYDKSRDRLNSSTTRACREIMAGVIEDASYKLQITHKFE